MKEVYMKYLFFLVVLFIANSIQAADANWYKDAACSTLMNNNNLVNGSDSSSNAEILYNCFGAGTGDTELINARNTFKLCFDTDSTASATGAARIQIKQCTSNSISANTCSEVYVDRNGDGVLDTGAMDGTVGTTQNRCTYNLPTGFYHVTFTVGRAGSELPIIQAQVQK